jgi:CelD/BcsL family acetyltransferase involved in cellulose biosynthesis
MERGWLSLAFLDVNGRRVATTLSFDYDNSFSLYNSGYDPAYSSLAVGLLHKALCIKHAIESGETRFDFLRGAEPYKYDLGGKDVPIYRFVVRRQA